MKELTNNFRQLVASLDEVKYRRRERLFKAEGTKCVRDTIQYFKLRALLATSEWLQSNPDMVSEDVIICSSRDIKRMSSMVTAPGVIAVYEIPEYTFDRSLIDDSLILALDSIRDPGNLGTIIRIADWFGINTILASTDTTDCYSPKVVQATMGSISRVKVFYTDLKEVLADVNNIFGTFLNGDDLGEVVKDIDPSSGIIVVGNESRGISAQIESLVTRKITIPSFPAGVETGESLNAAVATAIVVATFRQNTK